MLSWLACSMRASEPDGSGSGSGSFLSMLRLMVSAILLVVLERRGGGELSLLPLRGVGGLSVRRLLGVLRLGDKGDLGEA